MKTMKSLLCLLGCLLIFSAVGQKSTEEESGEQLSKLFQSVDQLGLMPDGKHTLDSDAINWMRLTRVYYKGCELIIEYIKDKKQNASAVCSVSVLHIKPGDLTLLELNGIPCLKLSLPGKYILFHEDKQNKTGKTSTIFFRACHDQPTYEALKTAFEQLRKSCMQH